jgi:hypothetical protein
MFTRLMAKVKGLQTIPVQKFAPPLVVLGLTYGTQMLKASTLECKTMALTARHSLEDTK